jgi:SAM-dependent methyltransferase
VIGLGRGELYERKVGPFERVQADAESLPFADGSFDLVFCVAALHHALDLPLAVRELARVTRTGGVVAALNEGTRPLRASAEVPDQATEKAFGINEHVHLLPEYVWAFLRARLVPVRLERPAGYDAFAHRTRIQKVLRLPGGRTALTVAHNLLRGYGGVSIYARKPR